VQQHVQSQHVHLQERLSRRGVQQPSTANGARFAIASQQRVRPRRAVARR
jgi:hypothetical protein